MMKGRLGLLGLLASASLLLGACSSRSEQANVKHIGILQYMEHESLTETRKGIMEELEKQGYENGKDIVLDYQNAQGDQASLQSISENLVKDNDLVIGIATQSSQALQAANIDKPIIFSAVTDPISAKLVKSMKNPAGLVTGVSNRQPLEPLFTALKIVLPKAKTVGMMYTTSERNAEVQVENAKALLKKAGYKIIVKGITSTNDVQDAAKQLMKETDVLYVPTDNIVASAMTLLGDLSRESGIPVIGGSADMVEEGGLMTYGPDYRALGRQTAQMAIKVLKGQKVNDIPAEYPKDTELVVNEEMAKDLKINTKDLNKK